MSALPRPLDLSPPYREAASQLETARGEIEDRFRTAGLVLNQVFRVVRGLAESLDQLTDALQGNAIESTTRDLLAAADQLSTLPERQAMWRRRLDGIRAASEALRPQLDEMRMGLKCLRMFIFNIKIVAAGAGDFQEFAGDMAGRVEAGMEELAAFDRQLMQLDNCISAALAFETSLGQQLAEVLPPLRRDLTADAEALRNHHRKIADAASQVAVLAQDVQAKLGRALGALQIGDITRQRIEHVQSALHIVDCFRTAAPARGPDRDRLGRASCRMLAAQMADLTQLFRRDSARVAESLTGMTQRTHEILQLRDLTYFGSENGGGSFLMALEHSVNRAKDLAGGVQAASREAEAVARSALGTAGDLADRVELVRQVKADIRLMALNTALRCSRMGDAGRPLAVIAAELTASAENLDVVAASAATALEDLTAEGEASPSAGNGFDPRDLLEDAIIQIRAAGAEAEAGLSGLADQSVEAAHALAGAERQLDLSSDLLQSMDQATRALEQLGGPDEPLGEEAAELAPLFNEIAQLYTMAREREIHALAAPPQDDPASGAVDAVGQPQDDLAAVLF